MHLKKIENFNKMDYELRYISFLETVLVNEEVWFLQNTDGLLGFRNDKNELLIPFWRDEEIISYYVEQMNEIEYQITNIDIHTFTEEVLIDMAKENQIVLVDKMPYGNGSAISPTVLRKNIFDKLNNY